MIQKDKELLLVDLSARLPYGVRCKLDLAGYMTWNEEYAKKFKKAEKVKDTLFQVVNEKAYYLYGFPTPDRVTLLEFEDDENFGVSVEFIKPYLRPMSSMTEKEAKEIAILHDIKDILSVKVTSDYIDVIVDDGVCSTERRTIWYDEIVSSIKCFDWLNAHHFDYRGLIEQGLALEVTEENNPYVMRIKIGHGTNGYIFEEIEKVKACNYCIFFKGYGLHACSGHCSKFGKDINGGYIGAYSETARECGDFEVRPELLEGNI